MAFAAQPVLGAQSDSSPLATQELWRIIEEQQRLMRAQQQQLEDQQERIENLESIVNDAGARALAGPNDHLAGLDYRASGIGTGRGLAYIRAAGRSGSYDPADDDWGFGGRGFAPRAQTAQSTQGDTSGDQPVGADREEDVPQEDLRISGVSEARGVLTPPGSFVIEPSLEYENTSSTRFFFNGVEVVETVLVGDIEVTEADRDALTARLNGRIGLTNRSEFEVSVPFVYRSDTVETQVVSTGDPSPSRDLDAADIGDVEVTGRYQLNGGNDGWPILIGNLRLKSATGKGPFDVDRDADGNEQELSTGSGFYGVQPSITAVYPTDPAVFYGGLSYLWNIGRDVNETIGDARVGHVDPGDVIGVNFGMGIGLNDKTSLSIGYEHNFIMETDQEINGVTVESDTADVGILTLGASYRTSDRSSVNLSVGAGLTEDAPDVTMTLRVPMGFEY